MFGRLFSIFFSFPGFRSFRFFLQQGELADFSRSPCHKHRRHLRPPLVTPWMYLFISSALSRWKAQLQHPSPSPHCCTAPLSTLESDGASSSGAERLICSKQAGIADFCLSGNLQIESCCSELSLLFFFFLFVFVVSYWGGGSSSALPPASRWPFTHRGTIVCSPPPPSHS